MEQVKTRVLHEKWDVDARLSELGLDRDGLLKVRDMALNERNNATPHHCANAAGTFAYQSGIFALRSFYAGKGRWKLSRDNGVESIEDEETGAKISFSNVDVACDNDRLPKPRTDKGAGSERETQANLFGNLPRYAKKDGKTPFYYLMMDERGAIELTRPVIRNGLFVSAVERLFIDSGEDLDAALLLDDTSDVVDDFEPQIIRK